MRPGFPGFPADAMTFFRALAKNNRREWFQPRKQIYEERVKAPMLELVAALNAEMTKFAPAYVREPERAVYRIYRDTRFSHDKTPYKTYIAAVFTRRGFEKHAGAGYYFSVSPEEIEVAGGVYMPGAEELRAIRLHLLENHAAFGRILRARRLRALLGELQGERLSRVPKGFPAFPRAFPRSTRPPVWCVTGSGCCGRCWTLRSPPPRSCLGKSPRVSAPWPLSSIF
jgi:uncharacterized protein (TIGR02453 family)